MARKESRKTTGTGTRRGQSAKREETPKEPARGEAAVRAETSRESEHAETHEGGGTATATLGLTHDQIAERAKQIWEQRGRPDGEDERNWREAERQLKREMGSE